MNVSRFQFELLDLRCQMIITLLYWVLMHATVIYIKIWIENIRPIKLTELLKEGEGMASDLGFKSFFFSNLNTKQYMRIRVRIREGKLGL